MDGKVNKGDSIWWRDLKKVCGLGENGRWFMDKIIWRVGESNRILFWDNLWLGDIPLKDKYLRMCNNSEQKGFTIRDIGSWHGNQWSWNLMWRRLWFGWEKTLVEYFNHHFRVVQIQCQQLDDVEEG